MYIEEVGLQPLNIPGENSKGEANQLHDVNMPQSKSRMAAIQDFWPLKDIWNFIHTHGSTEDYGRQHSNP
jgi:hypothetical protein